MKTLNLTSFETKIPSKFESFDINICEENNQKWFDVSYQFCDTEGHDQETYLMMRVREELDITIPELMRRIDKETKIKVLEVIVYTQNTPEYYYKTNHGDYDFDVVLTEWFNSYRSNGQSYIKNAELVEVE